MLNQGVLSWTPSRLAPPGGDGADGAEGDETWDKVTGWASVATLRTLFRISEKDGVGVGDSGSVRLGGVEVCALRVRQDGPAEDAESEVCTLGGGVEQDDEVEEEQAPKVAIDLNIRRVRLGGMTQAVLRRAITEEVGVVCAS